MVDKGKGLPIGQPCDPLSLGLFCFVSFQEMIQLRQEAVAVHAVHHAGFFNGFAPGRGAAQAMHTDGEEQGSALGRDVQNITDDGFFLDFNSHENDLLSVSWDIITAHLEKNKSFFHFSMGELPEDGISPVAGLSISFPLSVNREP